MTALHLLLTPPFDQAPPDPGYIKGYPPGIRENGGQYTHGAIWSVIAFAMLGEGDKAGELFALLNPINHASTRAGIQRYKVEPYVACGDVYSEPAHVGRGGWTWYTGSAGWMYRAGLEWILGFRLRGAMLLIDPCIPKAWRQFENHLSDTILRDTTLWSRILMASAAASHVLNSTASCCSGNPILIPLSDDGAIHQVRVRLDQTTRVGELPLLAIAD